MSNGIRFCLNIKPQDLRDAQSDAPSKFERELKQFCDEHDTASLKKWAILACHDFILQHAPDSIDLHMLTLERFYQPPTYFLKLVDEDGLLHARVNIQDQGDYQCLIPSIIFQELDIFPDRLHNVKRIEAAELQNVPELYYHFDINNSPKYVRTSDGLKSYYFKSAMHPEAFNREPSTYLRLQARPDSSTALVPKDIALAEWSTGFIMGLLIGYMEHTDVLSWVAKDADMPTRIKWMEQVKTTVQVMHRAGVVWGDVKPANILVNMSGDAVVIDFNGEYTHGWVDEELNETIEGDLQGLSRLRDYLELSA